MRIVHFSDIHAGGWIRGIRGYFDKRLLGALNYHLRRRRHHDWNLVSLAVDKIRQLAPDIVICTGDITCISQAHEFEQARSALMPLVDDRKFELLFVPGNHDSYVRDLNSRKRLEDIFRYINRNKWALEELPVSYDIGEVRFLLLNQALPTAFYESCGSVDDKTRNWFELELRRNLESGNRKLVLVAHFPLFNKSGHDLPFLRRCRNNVTLQHAFMRGDIQISFCGHIHRHFSRWEESGGLEVCAGSLTYNGKINLIDYQITENVISQEWIDVRED